MYRCCKAKPACISYFFTVFILGFEWEKSIMFSPCKIEYSNLLEDNDVGKTTTIAQYQRTKNIHCISSFCGKYILALLFCFSCSANGMVSNYSKCFVVEHLVTAYEYNAHSLKDTFGN